MPTQPSLASLYTQDGCRKYLNGAERDRFLQCAARQPVAVHALCHTLAHTGCRISEALALTARAVEVDAGYIAIRCLKKRTRALVIREIPVSTNLLSLIDSAFDLGQREASDRLWYCSRSKAWEDVKLVMREAGIAPGPHATPKGLRHTFGLHAIRCGVPLNLVQRWLGHANIATTALYLQALGPEEREFAARMWSS